MPKFIRKALVMVDVEAGYAVDPTLDGSDAFLVKNLRLTPMNAEFANRDVIRAYFGNSEQLPVGVHGLAEFDVELAGSGAAVTPPKWGRLLRACAMSQTITAADITGTAAAGAGRTITLAAGASAVDNFYSGMWIDITGGTGAGQSNMISSYVGSTKVANVTKTWTTPPNATSVYAIRANVQYRPISAALESVGFACNYDGVLHKLLGCRGSATYSLGAKGIPSIKFRLLGLYQTVTDAALVTPDYSAFRVPLVANSTNTPTFHFHDVSPVLQMMDLDLANNVIFRQLIGSEYVHVTDRLGAGKAAWEADAISVKDWFTVARNGTLDSMGLKHGNAAGNIVLAVCPYVQVKPPRYTDQDGIAHWESDLLLAPGVGAGNDELYITSM